MYADRLRNIGCAEIFRFHDQRILDIQLGILFTSLDYRLLEHDDMCQDF
jgi:hypothetical protein